jgi:glycosyltransferase involved in cell wall biosynthesis
MAPIPFGAGAIVLVTATALATLGALEQPPGGDFEGALADFCARGQQRGLMDLLDGSTFYARHRSPLSGAGPRTLGGLTLFDNHWVNVKHPMAIALVDDEAKNEESPLSNAFRTASIAVRGLRVVVDGSYLGPHEMGTQVSTLGVISALAQHPDVRQVVVPLPGGIPDYARAALTAPKVRAEVGASERLRGLGRCDVVHRPIQPDNAFSVDRWRAVGDRVVVTVLDLIAYRIGSYQASNAQWFAFRDSFRRGVQQADAVTVISDDVQRQVELERLPVDPSRLFVVPLGTDHLSGDEPAEIPDEFLARGFVAGEFVLCVGTDYSHKNRDIAVRAVEELHRRGWSHALVMAGPNVPFGGSRHAEAAAALRAGPAFDHDVFLLPDVPSAQRNWLFRHASAVLYPSSAEGFGFIPFEAARFGTPTVFVGFGPLGDLAGEVPVTASDWSPAAVATAAEALLSDQDVARRQVEACLAAGAGYTWTATGARLTEVYHHMLAMPPAMTARP